MTDPVEPLEPVDPDVDPEVAIDPEPDPVAEPEPEGPRRYPSTLGGAFYLAILITAATSIGIVMGGDWRAGVRVLAAGLACAGLVRLVLPQRDAGMLAVRHRLTDVAILAAVAAALWWLAGSIPDQPV